MFYKLYFNQAIKKKKKETQQVRISCVEQVLLPGLAYGVGIGTCGFQT